MIAAQPNGNVKVARAFCPPPLFARNTPPAHRRRSPRGAALMAVLWLIAILSMACMAALRVISFDTEIAAAKVHGSRARQFAEMGIAVGSNPVVKRTDPILRQLNEETGEGFEIARYRVMQQA